MVNEAPLRAPTYREAGAPGAGTPRLRDRCFAERGKCISDQYSTYTIIDEIKINGELTRGEDIADVGGLILAWMAWKMEVADKKLGPIDGLSPEQRFFVGYAQLACENTRPETLRARAITDPH